MTYFNDKHNLMTLRKEFIRLVRIHHPDKGGDENDFKRLNTEYVYLTELLSLEPVKYVPAASQLFIEPYDSIPSLMGNLESTLAVNDIKLIKPHQYDGVKWLMSREQRGLGGLLCDDMGLGKTMQMCSLIVGMPRKMTLIVLPPVIISQWIETLERVINTSPIDYRIIHFCTKDKHKILKTLIKSKVNNDNIHYIVLSSYQMLITKNKYARSHECVPRLNFKWDRVILDEVHYIRNPNSKSCRTVRNIRCSGSIWGLSGTPINNKAGDIKTILQIVLRIDLATLSCKSDRFKRIIKDSVLRRVKENVVFKTPLPECDVIDVHIPFQSQAEIDLYDCISRNVLKDLNKDSLEDIEVMTFAIFEQLIRMRQVTTDPSQAIKAVNKKWFKRNPIRDWNTTPTPRFPMYKDHPIGDEYGNNSKMNYLITDIIKDKYRLETSLIFCHFKSEIKSYYDKLTSMGFSVGRIDGSVSNKDKSSLLQNYKASKYDISEVIQHLTGFSQKSFENSSITNNIFKRISYDILLIQIDCGGTGLNLQAATRIYITSPHYNPAIELQSIARAHRIGQTRKVVIKKLLMSYSKDDTTNTIPPTIDTHIVGIQNKKIDIMTEVLEDDSYRIKTRVESHI